MACLSYTYLSTSLLYFIYSSLSFFFFIYPNFSFPLLLFVFSWHSVLDTITKWKPLSVKTLKTSHFIFQWSLFTPCFPEHSFFPIGTCLYVFEGLFSSSVHIIQFSSSSSASLITLFRILFWSLPYLSWLEPGHLSFPGALVVNNPPANAGNIRDVGSIPG